METTELLRLLAATCDSPGLRYFVVGSVATCVYGEPRYVRDIDVLLELPKNLVNDFCAAFPSESFSVDPQAATVARSDQFTIHHCESGLKFDVFIASDSDFDRSRLSRGRALAVLPDRAVTFAAPEYVILMNMRYFRDRGASLRGCCATSHLRDIVGVLRIYQGGLDRPYLHEWAAKLGVTDVRNDLLPRLDEPA